MLKHVYGIDDQNILLAIIRVKRDSMAISKFYVKIFKHGVRF